MTEPDLTPPTPVPALPSANEFTDKVALVTGGTEGLGKHIALTLASLGTDTFFCGRREKLGKAVADESGGRAHFIQCDLRDPGQVRAMVKQAGDFKDRLDYLVNNAAVDPNIRFATMTLEEFDRVLETDLKAFFLVTSAALPYLEKGTAKAIVNMGTTNYMKGIQGMTAYNAAKSGIIGFSRSLARELGETSDIRVNVISPGWTLTERQLRGHIGEKEKRYLIETQSIKKLMYPAHITAAVLFMLSKAASGITGQNVVVDGGQIMQ